VLYLARGGRPNTLNFFERVPNVIKVFREKTARLTPATVRISNRPGEVGPGGLQPPRLAEQPGEGDLGGRAAELSTDFPEAWRMAVLPVSGVLSNLCHCIWLDTCCVVVPPRSYKTQDVTDLLVGQDIAEAWHYVGRRQSLDNKLVATV
jgi:hypothetical protein